MARARRTPAAGGIEAVLDRLECWLARHRPRYLKSLAAGARPAELDRLQKAIGTPVPVELRALLSWHNGQHGEFAGHFEQDWDLLSADQIAKTKRDRDAQRPRTGWQTAWIPLTDDDADDHLCLDTSQPGAPVRAFWQGKFAHAVVASSLGAWFQDVVAAMERGEYDEDPERGTFARRSS
jgi:cell wall assembly regulator SMI1